MINPEHDAQVVTRIVQQDFPLWMSVTFYLAAFISTAIFSTVVLFKYVNTNVDSHSV